MLKPGAAQRQDQDRPPSEYDSLNDFEFDEAIDASANPTAADPPFEKKRSSHVSDAHKSWPYTNFIVDEVPEEEPPRPRRRPRRQHPLSSWWAELFSICISFGSFIGIIATLAVYNGRTISSWRLPISINAVIAILSAAFKSSVALPVAEGISQLKWVWFASAPRHLSDMETFDMASRGPWGSILLLSKHLFRSDRPVLAVLGALIIILALAVDPFTQGLINYYPCLEMSPLSAASIPRANSYTAFGNHVAAARVTLDGAMQLALYQGALDPPADPADSIAVSCPTGNCTFPAASTADPTDPDDRRKATFSTLAMCHACDDITSLIVNHATAAAKPGSFNYSLPTGALIYGSDKDNAQTPLLSAVSNPKFGFSAFDTLMMRYPPSCHDRPDPSPKECPMEAFAVRCKLHPCVNIYAANLTDTRYNETLLTSTPLVHRITDATHSLVMRDAVLLDGEWLPCSPSATQDAFHSIPVNTNTHTVHNLMSLDDPAAFLATRPPLDTSSSPSLAWYPPRCAFLLGSNAILGISSFLSDSLFPPPPSPSSHLTLSYGLARPHANSGPTWLQTLWHNGTASLPSARAFAAGLAGAASAQLRRAGNDTSAAGLSAVQGAAWRPETCVRVRWPWISFLAAVLAMELVFFSAVLLAGRRAGGGDGDGDGDADGAWPGDWKSSPLALLFSGLEDRRRGDDLRGSAAQVPSPVSPAPGLWWAAGQRFAAGGGGDAKEGMLGGGSPVRETAELRDMLRQARTMRVRLKRDSTGGWRFGESGGATREGLARW